MIFMKKVIFAGIAFVLSGQFAMAAENSVESLQNFSKHVMSAEGSFSQIVTDKNGKEIDNSEGTFVFSRPGKFIWKYEKPFPQYMICNGKELWIWDKDLNQVTIKKAREAIPESPASILFGNGNLKDSWNVKDLGVKDGLSVVGLSPKNENLNFSKISIGFKGKVPAYLEFVGSLGETSKIQLKDVSYENKFPVKMFNFEIPKGADVVKLD